MHKKKFYKNNQKLRQEKKFKIIKLMDKYIFKK